MADSAGRGGLKILASFLRFCGVLTATSLRHIIKKEAENENLDALVEAGNATQNSLRS
jgi:hypothetical protein